jgi:hypothetical protein
MVSVETLIRPNSVLTIGWYLAALESLPSFWNQSRRDWRILDEVLFEEHWTQVEFLQDIGDEAWSVADHPTRWRILWLIARMFPSLWLFNFATAFPRFSRRAGLMR